jgi:hypothetical protein
LRLLIVVALLFPAAAVAAPLELVCEGEAIKTNSETSYGTFNSGGQSASGSVTTYRKDRATERLRIRIEDDGATGTIKMPPGLVPPLHSGGRDGWWPLKSISMTDDRISASYQLNVLNQGSFRIDRRTGDIEAKALAMKFSGTCEKATEAPQERKF